MNQFPHPLFFHFKEKQVGKNVERKTQNVELEIDIGNYLPYDQTSSVRHPASLYQT